MKKVMDIINKWNPIKIYPLLEDEYQSESKQIMRAAKILNQQKHWLMRFLMYLMKVLEKSSRNLSKNVRALQKEY
jgi:hypothetical protein